MKSCRQLSVLFLFSMFLWRAAVSAAPFFASYKGPFADERGQLRPGWRAVRPRVSGTDVTGDFRWQGHRSLRLRSGDGDAILHSPKYQFPIAGTLRFTVWARATSQRAAMKIFIVGDGYHVHRRAQAKQKEPHPKVTM